MARLHVVEAAWSLTGSMADHRHARLRRASRPSRGAWPRVSRRRRGASGIVECGAGERAARRRGSRRSSSARRRPARAPGQRARDRRGRAAAGGARARLRDDRRARRNGIRARFHAGSGPRPHAARGGAAHARAIDGRGLGQDAASFSAGIRCTTRPPISTSRTRWRRSRRPCTCRLTTTRRRAPAPGTCRARTRSSRGATRAPATARITIAQPLIEPLFERPHSRGAAWPRSAEGRTIRDASSCGARGSSAPERREDDGGAPSTTASSPDPHGRSARRASAAWTPVQRRGRRRRRAPMLVFFPDARVYDGRFANNGWLQEFPDPMTKLTWDNAALVSPATADAAGASTQGDRDPRRARRSQRRASRVPHARPGAEHGRRGARLRPQRRRASSRNGVGVDVLRRCAPADALHVARRRARWRRPAGTHKLASTQDHHAIFNAQQGHGQAERLPELFREGDARRVPRASRTSRSIACTRRRSKSLFDDHDYDQGHKWGMAIDLNAVHRLQRVRRSPARPRTTSRSSARSEVARGREMHWIRIDRYFKGDADDARGRVTSRSRASTARTRRASRSARSRATVARPRRPERHGLQPLHRHAVLLEQLPVQGAPLQLLQQPATAELREARAHAARGDGLQPGRHACACAA